MDFEDQIQKAVNEIQNNHDKIIDDWCKAYLAQRYEQGKKIEVGCFTLCQQSQPSMQNGFVVKYWFEDGKPDLSINNINFSKEEIENLLIKFDNLNSDECFNYEDPVYSVTEKLKGVLKESLKELDYE